MSFLSSSIGRFLNFVLKNVPLLYYARKDILLVGLRMHWRDYPFVYAIHVISGLSAIYYANMNVTMSIRIES